MNGRGDDTMIMFQGYAHMVDFFTSFDWWKTEPHDDLVNAGNYCLAKPGELYAIYLPRGGSVSVRMEPGSYEGAWWDAGSGRKIPVAPFSVTSAPWTAGAPDGNDWALLLRTK